MNSLLSAGLILLLGFVGARILKLVRLPSVTAFLVVGILIGPQLLNLVTEEIFTASEFFSNLVLGLIAFSLGENFRLDNLRQGMKQVMWISLSAALLAWVLVSSALVVYFITIDMPIYPAIVLGAAASATAPAATVLVIREYRASGILTELLLKVVAIDDAWCLIFAAMAIAVGNAMRADVFQMSIVFAGLGEIFGALLLGGVLGYLSSKLSRFVRTSEELLVYALGLLFLDVGLSIALEVSVLLSAMMMGLVLVNMRRENYKFFEVLRSVDTPLYLVFFIISGAHLDFSILYKMGIAGILYVAFRMVGKVYGARIGAKISNAPKSVKNWLGLSLTPQAGVALGIGLVAKVTFPDLGNYIFTIIAATSVIFELAGPLLTKYSLVRAGEISPSE
ncbi:MAG: cation:proton antiporter [candidate division WOR-3 bacterium]|nr:MAG: cation:proton antiporter [candidate division WOR-3 bacterium]